MKDLRLVTALSVGSHPAGSDQMCVNEAIAFLTDDTWTDRPRCLFTSLSTLTMELNDTMPYDARQRLIGYIPRLASAGFNDYWVGSVVRNEVRAFVDAAMPPYSQDTSKWSHYSRLLDTFTCSDGHMVTCLHDLMRYANTHEIPIQSYAYPLLDRVLDALESFRRRAVKDSAGYVVELRELQEV